MYTYVNSAITYCCIFITKILGFRILNKKEGLLHMWPQFLFLQKYMSSHKEGLSLLKRFDILNTQYTLFCVFWQKQMYCLYIVHPLGNVNRFIYHKVRLQSYSLEMQPLQLSVCQFLCTHCLQTGTLISPLCLLSPHTLE